MSRRFEILVTLAVVSVVVVVLAWTRGLGVVSLAETLTRGGVRFWIAVIPGLLVLLVSALKHTKTVKQVRAEALAAGKTHSADARDMGHRRATHTGWEQVSPTKGTLTVAALAALMFVVSTVYAVFVHGYLTNVAWSQDAQTVDTTVSYEQRGPWVVAARFASRDQGDVVGDRGPVRHVPGPTSDTGSRYTTAIKARHAIGLDGYAAVQTMHMPLTGQINRDATTYCEVPDGMDRKLDAFWPQHNLSWAIYQARPNAHFDTSDAYSYCNEDGPVIVVPLWAYDGWWTVTKVPAGAAVYTPAGLKVYTAADLAESDVEGPTYPMSVAERQREALRGMFSFTQYYSRTAGYDLTSKDFEDTNSGNSTEFILVDTDGQADYVTPLTPRGSSQSITALAVVPARQDGNGRLPVEVNTAVDLPATSTIATNIREASISGDNSWTSRWAAGMKIYEILPGKDGSWVASIGQGQAVSYRATVSPGGLVEVTNVTTGQSSTAQAGQGTIPSLGDRSVADLTDAELLELLGQVVSEMENRQSGTDSIEPEGEQAP